MEKNKKKLPNNVINFLKEYQDLCQKYKMGLKGCGCCGSPYLDFDDNYNDVNCINYNNEENCIEIDDITLNKYLKEMEED